MEALSIGLVAVVSLYEVGVLTDNEFLANIMKVLLVLIFIVALVIAAFEYLLPLVQS